MEFKEGDPERGRGVFEGILRNYPKRLDLWSIYLDQACALLTILDRLCCCCFLVCMH